ncbi:MBL fold metallo-hydrolase [Mucilaginibacter sp. SMC90]|uniref:MBL fold metallo-hydrolase n=1 Tax=Mucilaginibacter sp. SMC90 TaxID=2929803 RepID=UPI001FB231F0|nr:MBL fold metallo-hydrolase [Mucilaginibacter sp. SMC90]UOE52755.1 MBL fold metallo-hydrolase [Mucilaginibacter sp. SMC90]
MNRRLSTKYFQVSQRVWGTKLLFVNVYMIANRPGAAKGWVLVDTGLKGSAGKIIAMAEDLFGLGTRPAAIVLTHGHGDHSGGLEELLKVWNVPVYAHALELPYLTGLSSYPPTDPSLRDGVMSLLSVFFPTAPINLGTKVKAIDMEEGIQELPEWKVIHTPGHTPGHISLFLPINSTLLVGDAFSTTKAESALYSLSSFKKLTGPPRYFTTDWEAAAESVRRLTALEPRAVAAGHGPVMRGRELHDELHELADNFEQLAVPAKGRYVGHPAVADEMGVKYIPPYVSSGILKASIGVAAALATFFIIRGLQE